MTTPILRVPGLRRWALVVGGLLGGTLAAHSQALNYTTATAANVAGTYTDLGTAGTAIATTSTDDDNSAAQPIGFTFNFNGKSFTQFVLNTNGLIRLGSAPPSTTSIFGVYEAGQPATGTEPISSADKADVDLIMPFNFDLLEGTGTPGYRVATTGTAPNRVCTIQWKNVSDKSGTTRLSQYANFSFQAKLYETTNRVEFVYDTPTASSNPAISRFPTVGIKGAGGSSGQTVLASKPTGAAAWSTTTFITGAYAGSTHNFNSTALPDAGRTYRFDTGTPAAAPANDDCAGAVVLTAAPTCTATAGTTVAATQSLAAIACGGFTGNADDDVWYQFVATGTTHTVTVVGSATFDAVIDVRSGTCATSTNIACADASLSGGTETATLGGLTVGSTYFVRVYTYGAVAGTFTICVTGSNGAACAAVTNAAVANNGGTATTASSQLTFTPAAGAANYILTLTPTGSTGSPTTTTLAGSPVNLTGLTPNTSYTVTITTNCTNGGTSTPVTVVFTSGAAVPPPANDNPTGAIALTVGSTCTPTSGTNVGATTTTVSGYTNPGTCGIAASPKDVWYSFTTLAGQTAATVTVTGNPAGLVRVFSAASNAGPFTQVSCAAGTGTNTVAAPVSLTGLTGSTTYYVSVSGYGSNDTQGAFTICVTGASATCPAVTGLAAGNITSTGATLSFTAAAGATNYTVTYTPAGGTAQTQTATASPVTLTNLQSNKQYTVSVVTNCGAGQASAVATTTFTTLQGLATRTALGSGELAVYPNPARQAFTVSLPALGTARTAQVELVNVLGQAVRRQTVSLATGGTRVPFDAAGLPTGLYSVQVRVAGETAVTRLVLE